MKEIPFPDFKMYSDVSQISYTHKLHHYQMCKFVKIILYTSNYSLGVTLLFM